MKPPQRDRGPPLLHQGGQQGEGGGHQLTGQHQPEPGERMVHGPVAGKAEHRRAAVQEQLNHAHPPGEAQILLGQGLRRAGLHVLAGGEQLVLRHLEDRADVPDKGDVRVGHASLPLADRRLGDKELVGKFPLGESQIFPAAADVRAEGLFAFHIQTSSFAAGVCLAGSLSPYGPGDKIASLWRHFPTRPLGKSLFCKGFPAVGAQRLAFRMPMRYGSRCLAGHIRKRMPAR